MFSCFRLGDTLKFRVSKWRIVFSCFQMTDRHQRCKISFSKTADGSIWRNTTLVLLYIQSYVKLCSRGFANKEKCKVTRVDAGYRYDHGVRYVKLCKIMNVCGKKSHVLRDWASQNYLLRCIMPRYLGTGFTDDGMLHMETGMATSSDDLQPIHLPSITMKRLKYDNARYLNYN